MGGWKLFSQFGEPPARQGALDARQQVVVDVEMLHLLQPLQILEGFHAVVVQVQDLEKYKRNTFMWAQWYVQKECS